MTHSHPRGSRGSARTGRTSGGMLRGAASAQPPRMGRTGGAIPQSLRRMRSSPLRRVLTVIALIMGVALTVGLSNQYARTYTLARHAARLEQHKKELVEQNTRLREEIQKLQTDDRYVERLARQQLGLVRPGEIELLIVPPGGGSSRTTPAATQPGPGRSAGGAGGVAAPGPGSVTAREPGALTGPSESRAAPLWSSRFHEIMQRLFGWLHR